MIDFFKLAKSVEFYSSHGFKEVEASWWVSKEVSDITRPEGAKDYFLSENNKCLVASGEQSFLYMATKGMLPEGRYQTITPCFRNESIGKFSRKCFYKNELIETQNPTQGELVKIIDICLEFFKGYIEDVHVIEEKDSYDIVTKEGIELGSYGIRECEFLKWIYATGCAEPRLSLAIKTHEFYKNKGKQK